MVSTVVTTRRGELLGTTATCFRSPYRPEDRDIRLIELATHQAADFIENSLRAESLREADRRKEEALAALAHEIRNPLSVIMNAGQALQLKVADDSRSAELCELVVRHARQMVRLAGELIESSRAGATAARMEVERVDVHQAIVKAIEAVTQTIEDRRHELRLVAPSEPLAVAADPFRLEQILVNLLLNAAQYTAPGGRITLEAWGEGHLAAIRVRDTGLGISAELLPRIFDPFVRGASEPFGNGPPYNLGLGLALVKFFAERHGGNVTAASEGTGRGSAFTLRLPKAHEDGMKPASAGEHSAAPAVAEPLPDRGAS
jgi:signal transduction histidine kinase